MKPPDLLVAAHEAGHAVACYSLNLPLAQIEIWHDRGLIKLVKPSRPIFGGAPGDVFDHSITLLAGAQYIRSLGLDATGDEGDFAKASFPDPGELRDRGHGATGVQRRESRRRGHWSIASGSSCSAPG